MPTWMHFLSVTVPVNRRAALAAALAGFAACASWPAAAQQQPQMVPPRWQPPAIVIPEGQGRPIQLKSITIDTDVFAGQAQTRFELQLYNPNDRVLEGELQFPLLEGQVVTGFALDINGQLRDAVPVPKAKGQEIFEDIRRRRVDPGLLEATAGNQYKLRVYPIPARGERRVQITVTETLPVQKGLAVLRVPLVYSSAVGDFAVRVRVPGAKRNDVRMAQGPAGTQLAQVAEGVEARLQRKPWAANAAGASAWLQLAIRQAPAPQVMVGESGNRRFFTAQVPFKDEPVRRTDPSHIALVWDASASAAAAQGKVLPVLDAYFRSLRKQTLVSLVVVRNRAEFVRRFSVSNGNWSELMEALRAQPFDGSSNFDALPIPDDADLTVLVTDGLATDGKRLFNYSHIAPVLAINGSATADVPRLARLAERTGGALIDATLLTPDAAAAAMQRDGWRIERLSSPSATQLAAPVLRLSGDRIAVAGEMGDASARIDVALVHPDGRKRVVPLNITARPTAGRWPGQQWAQWRSAELAENAAQNKAQLQEIAAVHGIVGPNSSLIVLELPGDYVRYDLPAPPDLVASVERIRTMDKGRENQQRQNHIELMVRQFTARQAWWEKEFPKDKPAPDLNKEREERAAALGEASRRRDSDDSRRPQAMATAPAPAPMAAPAPPPPAPPAPGGAPAAPAGPARLADAAKPAGQQGTIALQPWTANAPYVKRLQEATAAKAYDVYLDERAQNAASSSFYMDAAALFFERGQADLALRILSNLAEMNLENRQLLRMYGYRLVQSRRSDLAVPVFERISDLAPNEPQSWRDLGLALAETNQPQLAVNALWEVVSRPWNSRFSGVGMIALAELNAVAAQAEAKGSPVDMARVDARLRRNLPLGLRVVMAWDTDDTDIDLWVVDPLQETASYSRRLTFQGGAMSPDATGGYGPEEFALRQAKPGKYVVKAQFYGQRQQVLSAGTTVMVRVTTGFGTPQARDEWLTLRLTAGKETVTVGEIDMR